MLLNLGDEINVYIPGKHIGVIENLPGAEVHLVQHSGQGPGVREGHIPDIQHRNAGPLAGHRPLPPDVEGGAQLAQQLLCRQQAPALLVQDIGGWVAGQPAHLH